MLRGQVLEFRGFTIERASPRRRLLLPDCAVKLIIGFANPVRVLDAIDPRQAVMAVSVLNPARATACVGERFGPLDAVAVRMTPMAAYRVLAIPLGELAGQAVDLVDLLGSAGQALAERLAARPGWQARFGVLEEWLAGRLREAPEGSPEVAAAWRMLGAAAGALPVGELTASTGWSRRRLERHFAREVGLTPKAAAGVLRLRRALRLKHRGLSWPEAAVTAGYYDQPHLNHCFSAAVGHTPQSFHASRAGADPGDVSALVTGRHTSILLDAC